MKKLFWLVFLLASPAFAQYAKVSGFCEDGNQQVNVAGLLSVTRVQRSYPLCTVSVVDTGTTNQSSIYSNATGSVLGNPFTAAVDGQWSFYGTSGNHYDVTFSGGGIAAPFTRADFVAPSVNVGMSITAFGGVSNYRVVTDGAITISTATFTSATAAFVAKDQGKVIKVKGAGTAGADLITTILTINSATSVTLAASAATSVTNAVSMLASDNSTALQNAINFGRTDMGGAGYVTILFPPGYYPYLTGMDINTDNVKVTMIGSGWQDTILEHLGAATNGGIYVHGTTLGPPTIARNGSWFELQNLSLGSANDYALNFVGAGLNSRYENLWLFNGGTNLAIAKLQQTGIQEWDHVRWGPGNMGDGSNWLPVLRALTFSIYSYALWALNTGATGLVGELHFNDMQSHSGSNCHNFVFQKSAGGGGSFFDVSIVNSQIKVDPTQANPCTGMPGPGGTISSIYTDGAEVRISDSYFEQTGTSGAVQVLGTNGVGSVYISNSGASSGDIIVNQANSGSMVWLDHWTGNKIQLVGAAGGYRIVSSHSTFAALPTGTPLIEGEHNLFGTFATTMNSGSPYFQSTMGGATSTGARLPSYSNFANAINMSFEKYRGDPITPANINSGDSVYQITGSAQVNGTLQGVSQIVTITTGSVATNPTGQVQLNIATGGSYVNVLTAGITGGNGSMVVNGASTDFASCIVCSLGTVAVVTATVNATVLAFNASGGDGNSQIVATKSGSGAAHALEFFTGSNQGITIGVNGAVAIGIPTGGASASIGNINVAGAYFANNTGVIDSTGNLTGATFVRVGASGYAAAGAVRLPNATAVNARNFAGGADINLIRSDASNNVLVGDVTNGNNLQLLSNVGIFAAGLITEPGTKSALCFDTGINEIEYNNGVATCTVSSLEFKDWLRDLSCKEAQRIVKGMRPAVFKDKDGSDGPRFGFAAEWTEKVEPKLVDYANGKPRAVDYERYTAVLTRYLQCQ